MVIGAVDVRVVVEEGKEGREEEEGREEGWVEVRGVAP